MAKREQGEPREVVLMRQQLIAAQDRGTTAQAQASLLRDELRTAQQHVTRLLQIMERQGEVIQGFVARLPAPGAARPM